MKKILLIPLLLLVCIITYAQNYNKEQIAEFAKKQTYKLDLLSNFGIEQKLPFGLSSESDEYIEYINDKPEKIKKNKWFTDKVSYSAHKFVYKLALKSKNFEEVKKILISQLGEPRIVRYVRYEPSIEWANEYVFDILDKYYISIRDNGEFNIYALDFMENRSKYDEFSKVGISYFDFNNMFNLSGDSKIYFTPAYVYNKTKIVDYNVFKIEYRGDEWMFLNKIEFLLDDGSLMKFELSPDRTIEKLIVSSDCVERDNLMLSDADWSRLIKSSKTKIKFTGKNFNTVFLMNPIQVYGMKVVSLYKESKMLLD